MEILAPCGNTESFNAAINAGANAVYFGLKRFSARGNAANFSFDELEEAVSRGRVRGVKIYLAFNTLVFDDELDVLRGYVEKIVSDPEKYGIDAVITQDLGVASIVRESGIPIHGSTQMTVMSVGGLTALKELGFSRVVLARELSREEIRYITGEAVKIGIETEVFVHGAHCVCVSGQCYMSSLLGGSIARSGNRGMCAQPCRLDFRYAKSPDVHNSPKNFALSLKDLSLIRHISELRQMGVTSLKIEGRMKRPEYVASAVRACKSALKGQTPDMKLLRDMFSRDGFTDGYFTGNYANMNGIRTVKDIAATKKALGTYNSKNRRGKKKNDKSP